MISTRSLLRNLLIGFVIVLLLGTCVAVQNYTRQTTKPKFAFEMGSSTDDLDLQWTHRIAPPDFANDVVVGDDTAVAFLTRGHEANLAAFDGSTGSPKWNTAVPFEKSLLQWFLYGYHTIFAVTSLGVDAYDVQTGQLLWSTELGQGRVPVRPQLDGLVLRIYYGETMYELDPVSGKIISNVPRQNLYWIVGHIEIHQLSLKHMVGKDRITGKQIWESYNQVFYLDPPPQEFDDHTLLVKTIDRGICALGLDTGEYTWCRSETYISNLAIHYITGVGYVLREGFVLEKIDLRTGTVLAETTFLPSPVTPDVRNYGYPYYVSLDSNKLLLLFGDSQQLFSLGLK
jgi:outer membrane protein assembly factor BamB